MVSGGSLKRVLEILVEVATENQDNEMLNNIVSLQQAHTHNEKENALGKLLSSDYSISRTKVINGLLYFIDATPEKYFGRLFASELSPANSTVGNRESSASVDPYTLRQALNDLLQKLVDTYKYEFELNNQHVNFHKQSDYLQEIRVLLARQAVWIMDRMPDIAVSTEYSLVARMLYNTRNIPKAEEYHKKAIEIASSSFDLISHVRSYADFLYLTANRMEGAKQYTAALLPNDTNDNKAINGYTYQMWFRNEALQYAYEDAKEIYKKARQHYESISDLRTRNYWLERLEKEWSAHMPFNVEKPF